MRIRPRQQLLDLWRAVLECCLRDDTWVWGGRDGSNSISDVEQLLCLLYPATSLAAFTLDQPDDIAEDAKNALAPFGTETRIGSVLVNLIEAYFERYTDQADEPVFATGSYRRSDERTPTADEQSVEIVVSYSMSLRLCIAALRFLKGYERSVSGLLRDEPKVRFTERMSELQDQVGARLTAAMTGLVRSFVIHTTEPETEAGQAILHM